jgi:hypothetical protein
MSGRTHWAFNVCVAASLLLVAVGLHSWGAAEIRANWGEVFFLTFVGALEFGFAAFKRWRLWRVGS